MADPKLWSKLDSTDVEDAAELGPIHSMKPVMPRQRHCNCIHDALPHTPGARRSRNLVVCIDGTANQFNDKNTNVVELYSRLEKSDHLQVTFYNSGIGTYASPSWKSLTYYRQVIYHKIDLAVAWRFEKILLSAYRWLCEQYQTGDRIFLFGFSRGAYQVRALSAMIEKVGLIHRGNEAQIPFAYDLYQKVTDSSNVKGPNKTEAKPEPNKTGTEKAHAPPRDNEKQDARATGDISTTPPERGLGAAGTPSNTTGPKQDTTEVTVSTSTKATGPGTEKLRIMDADSVIPVTTDGDQSGDGRDAAASFKRTFCREDVKVHFIGVWDTVSSVGFAKKKELPLTTEGMRHVCIFRHALALDERRVKFLPEFVNGGTGPEADDRDAGSTEMPHTKEVWFTGTHSDIGGGNIENKWLNNNGPALRWMTTEASKAGLLLTPFAWNWEEVKKAKEINESLTGIWRLLEILPLKRLSYANKHEITRRPHLGHRRKILPGQLVHRSVYGSDRLHLEYRDKLGDWNGKDTSKIEPDKYDQVTHHIEYAIELLSNMEITASDFRFHHLMHLNSTSGMFGTDEAIQAYINLSQNLFHSADLNKEPVFKRILATMEVLQRLASSLFQKQHLSRQPPVIRQLLRNKDQLSEATRHIITGFLSVFGTAEIFSIRRNGPVTSFTFSPDSNRIACGTESGTVFFRNVQTGGEIISQWDRSVLRSNGRISCLAFSPDGTEIASGGWDSVVRIWSVETGKLSGFWSHPHSRKILSISFSCDGSLAITSECHEVLVITFSADYKTVTLVTAYGHQHDLLSVVFSPRIEVLAGTSKPPNTLGQYGHPSTSLGIPAVNPPANKTPAENPPANNTVMINTNDKVGTTTSGADPSNPSAHGKIDQGVQTISIPEAASRSSSISAVTALSSHDHKTSPPVEAASNNPSQDAARETTTNTRDTRTHGQEAAPRNESTLHPNPQPNPQPNPNPNPNPNPDTDKNKPMTGPTVAENQGVNNDNSHSKQPPPQLPPNAPSAPSPPPQYQTATAYIVSASRDRSFRVWNFNGSKSNNQVHIRWISPPQGDEIRAAGFSKDGSQVFVGSRDGSISRWNSNHAMIEHAWLASASKTEHFTSPGGERIPVNSLSVAPLSLKVACGLEDGRVTLWDLSSGFAQFQFEVQHPTSVMSVSFSLDEKRFAACTKEGIVVVWDANGPTGDCILKQLTENNSWFPNRSKGKKPA